MDWSTCLIVDACQTPPLAVGTPSSFKGVAMALSEFRASRSANRRDGSEVRPARVTMSLSPK